MLSLMSFLWQWPKLISNFIMLPLTFNNWWQRVWDCNCVTTWLFVCWWINFQTLYFPDNKYVSSGSIVNSIPSVGRQSKWSHCRSKLDADQIMWAIADSSPCAKHLDVQQELKKCRGGSQGCKKYPLRISEEWSRLFFSSAQIIPSVTQPRRQSCVPTSHWVHQRWRVNWNSQGELSVNQTHLCQPYTCLTYKRHHDCLINV